MSGTTLGLTLVIGFDGNHRAKHDIGANPSVEYYLGGIPHARHNIGSNPCDRH